MADKTITVDIYSRFWYNDTRWIPNPISKPSPQLGCTLTIDGILELLSHSEVWLYDSSTQKSITTTNLNKYFPDFIPPYNRGGSGGGGGGTQPGALIYRGKTNTPLVDGDTTTTITKKEGTEYTGTITVSSDESGDTVIVDKNAYSPAREQDIEFIWDGEQWNEVGSSMLLVTVANHKLIFTPGGSGSTSGISLQFPIVQLSSTDYANLSPKNPATLYVVTYLDHFELYLGELPCYSHDTTD